MTPEMATALVAAVTTFNTDDGIRCVILTGAGDRVVWMNEINRPLRHVRTSQQHDGLERVRVADRDAGAHDRHWSTCTAIDPFALCATG